MHSDGSTHSTPRWVSVFGFVLLALLLLLLVTRHFIGAGLQGHTFVGHSDHAPRSSAADPGTL